MKTKTELCGVSVKTKSEALAELSGLARSAGVLGKEGGRLTLTLSTENHKLAPHVNALCSAAGVKAPVSDEKARTKIIFSDAGGFLSAAGIIKKGGDFDYLEIPEKGFLRSKSDRRAFIRGYFIGSGFVSTGKNAHLEVSFTTPSQREFFATLFDGTDLVFGNGERDGRLTMYLKSKDKIADFLTFAGASSAALDVLSEIVSGDVKKRMTATGNCDMANINKMVESAAAVAEALRKIESTIGLDSLSDKLRTTAIVRTGFMEEPLGEIAAKLGVSKSCVKHRLDRIIKIADSL